MSIRQAIQNLKCEMDKLAINAETGLGKELFLFASTLTPIVNVDLLVTNEKQQILLSWRNDPHSGNGWHIPGGCIRFKEKMEERIQKTAQEEFGTPVQTIGEPIQVFEIFSDEYREGVIDQCERAHFITLVYHCRFLKEFQLEQGNRKPGEPGYLQWFDTLPDDLLTVQSCYRARWSEICKKLWRND